MSGKDLIARLMDKLEARTHAELAAKLDRKAQWIQTCKNSKSLTERQIAGLILAARRAGLREAHNSALRPIVEFFPIDRTESKRGRNFEILCTKTGDGGCHAYLQGLKEELNSHFGVYVFSDSRGRAIYVGKARKQSLWKEMNLAYNRERGEVQKIKRVSHPSRNQAYATSRERARQIADHVVPLHELAEYFSAYDVSDGMINDLEAMLVRSFANDLLNQRMERFSQQRRRTGA